MSRRVISVLAFFAIGITLVVGFRALFPAPETVIRRRLAEMARLVSFAANEGPLAKLANPQQLASYLSQNVEVSLDVPGRGQQTFSGREELIQATTVARSQLSALTVELPDVAVSVAADRQTASADVTVKANIGGQREAFIQELKITLEKKQGDWVVTRFESSNTLK